MMQGNINQLLKSRLKCFHFGDPRRSRSPYFPLMCETCGRFARIHLEGILQEWIYRTRDSHGAVMLNPIAVLQQIQRQQYGELFVRVTPERVYVIAKFSAHEEDFINDVKTVNRINNLKEIYFTHSDEVDEHMRMDRVESVKTNYHNRTGLIIGEIYLKFDINEVNAHLDIVNDPHVRVIPNKVNNDTFTFIYKFF